MKTSLVVTVLNEEKTIKSLISSIFNQTLVPDEVIVVDGGSTDATASVISNKHLKFFSKKGNRAVGRNYGIGKSSGDIILITDAGCVLDKNWVKNMIKPFSDKSADVVAGYYDSLAKNSFQKCIAAYVLVMPDRINPNTFLPASRSMGFRKKIWAELGGFPEKYSHNEDYVFAQMLKKHKKKIVFKKEAIAYWIPRDNLKDAFIMFYRFALGDAESGIIRPKVFLLFTRTLPVIYLLLFFLFFRSVIIGWWLVFLFFLYIIWSIAKNFRYIGSIQAFVLLPLIQLTADFAVFTATLAGLFKSHQKKLTWVIRKIQ